MTIKLKHTEASAGRLMTQNPNAKPGRHGGCITIAVVGLPEGATFADAVRVAENVMMPAWIFTIDAEQEGKNLYRAENLTHEQFASAPDWYRERYRNCREILNTP